MVRPWYRKRPDELQSLKKEIEETYPDLHFVDRDDKVMVRGYLPISSNDRVWDRYRIEISLPTDSPRGLPEIRELDARIPPVADRHVFTDTKAVCVMLPDAYWYEFPNGLDLIEFLGGPLLSFLANQSLIERGCADVWPDGEWGHGALGIYEFYSGILGIEEPTRVMECLMVLLKSTRVKGHWMCPCGSGTRIRKCHGPSLIDLQSKVPTNVIERARGFLAYQLREMSNRPPSSATENGPSRGSAA